MTSRIIDLIAPIGKGQRGLIVSPPKAGKTTIMKTIAQVDRGEQPRGRAHGAARRRAARGGHRHAPLVKGEVVASTFDRPSEEHTQVAELTIERAKRMVEMGSDVVIILDGITRLARAYNLAAPATGRIMSRRHRHRCAVPAEEVLRCGPQRRGGRLAHHPRHGPRRHRLQDGRGDLRGVQGHRQHGAPPRPPRWPRSGCTRPSTSTPPPPATRSCSSSATSSSRSGSCAGCCPASRPRAARNAGLELLIDRMKTFPTNDVFLAEIAKAPAVG